MGDLLGGDFEDDGQDDDVIDEALLIPGKTWPSLLALLATTGDPSCTLAPLFKVGRRRVAEHPLRKVAGSRCSHASFLQIAFYTRSTSTKTRRATPWLRTTTILSFWPKKASNSHRPSEDVGEVDPEAPAAMAEEDAVDRGQSTRA